MDSIPKKINILLLVSLIVVVLLLTVGGGVIVIVVERGGACSEVVMGRVVVGVALGLLLCDCVNLISVMANVCGRSRHFIESKTESEKEWLSLHIYMSISLSHE